MMSVMATRTQPIGVPQVVSLRQSPSRPNMDILPTPISMDNHSKDITFEHLLSTERKKARSQHQRAKTTILMTQLDLKQRLNLEKKIHKKFEKHEKVLKKEEKDKRDKLVKWAAKNTAVKNSCLKKHREFFEELETN